MRQVLLTCAALILVSGGAVTAQETGGLPGATNAQADPGRFQPAAGVLNAPLLRQFISLDLRDAPFADALEVISRKLGGRLMYDHRASSLGHRITMREKAITAGEALTRILRGTGLRMVIPEGTSLVLLKRLEPKPILADSVTVRGRVVDASTGEPVDQVLVSVDDGDQRSMTNSSGNFVIMNVPVGEHLLSFERLGYETSTITLTLTAGRDTTLTVQLTPAPILLNEIVTTVTGERLKYRVGNAIPVIDAAEEVQTHAYRNLSDLLAGRANGVTVMPGGSSPNSPSRLRIRGINSILASNEPIVIIDGVRAVSGYTDCPGPNMVDFGCDQLSSRFDDLNLHSIESIEILRGPSAAAMWGSQASNGVIVINTKRGRAGPTRWTLRYSEGFTTAPTGYFIPMQGLGSPANGTAVIRCRLLDQATGRCIPIDSVRGGFNRYANPRTTSMAMGRTSNFGLNVSGGGEEVQFYLSGGYENSVGTAKMPAIDRKLVRDALGRPLPEWMVRPNARSKASFTGRLTGQFHDRLDYSLTTRFIQLETRAGADGVMSAATDLRSVADTFELSAGWEQFYVERKHKTTRFIGSLSLNWRPTTWFTGRAVLGRDYGFTNNGAVARRNWCLPFCTPTSTAASGQVAYGEQRRMTQTVDLGGTLRMPIMDGKVVLRTAFGAQHTRTRRHDFEGRASDLPVGRTDFNGAPSDERSVFQSSDDRATFGMYLHQSVGLNDRLFVSGAVRRDIGSALGAQVAPLYPKWGISWFVSEAPWFEFEGIRLRLRGAYGHAGVQPSTTAKYRSFSQNPNFVGADGSFGSNYAYLSGVGNTELSPERSVEMEGGFELGLWNDRLMFDFTYFHKYTHDALIRRDLPPSLGLSSLSQQVYNVGDVRNAGMEARLTALIINRPDFQWWVNVGYATRENELVSLAPGVEPFSITASNIELAEVMDNDGVVKPGYPLFGRWARPIIGYSDVNADGIIVPGEVRLADTLVFMGGSQPDANISVRPELRFWNGRVRVGANFAYVHGLTQFNQYAATNAFRDITAYDPDTPLHLQACAVAANPPLNNDFCFYETVNVLRMRSIMVGFTVPDDVAQMLGAGSATLQVLGSNLGVWTDYKGIDPMVNTESAGGNRLIGGAIVPRGQTWTLRARLTY